MASGADLAFELENIVIPPHARTVRDFVNTIEYQLGDERLRTPDDLGEWLVGRGLLDDRVRADAAHLELAKSLREGLRAVLETHAGHDPDPSAMRRFNDALRELPVQASFSEAGRFELLPSSGDPVRGALAKILDAVRATSEDGTWDRLKACSRESCRWAYFDHSRNRSSRWCTMAGCGNIVKMKRAHQSRKRNPPRPIDG